VRNTTADPIGAAIRRVLDAERAADADVARTQAQAEQRVRAARIAAAAVAERADRRLAAVHRSVSERIAGREAETEAAIRALRAGNGARAAMAADVAAAVAVVVDALTGGSVP
jgi:vacuolar-type H+-ATPase subunit H